MPPGQAIHTHTHTRAAHNKRIILYNSVLVFTYFNGK